MSWAARATALDRAAPAGRGARLLKRHAGEPLATVCALAAVPAWLVAPPVARTRLAAAVVVLQHRPAIDAELQSAVLAPLAALTGEAAFDALCQAPVPAEASAGALPPVAQIEQVGTAILVEGLPAVLGGAGDARAVALTAVAQAIIARTPS